MLTVSLTVIAFDLCADSAAQLDGLNERAAALNAKLAKFTEDVADLDADPCAVTEPAFRKETDLLDKRRLSLLAQEYELRQDLVQFLPTLKGDLRAAQAAADAAEAETREELTRGLAQLGYAIVPEDGSWIRIVPDFYHRHPGVRAAMGKVQELASRDDELQALVGRHADRIGQIDGELAGIRRRMTAGLAAA